MTIELTGEAEATVLRLAEESGMTPAQVVADMMAQAEWIDELEDDPDEQRIIEERLAEADREDLLLTHEEVGRRLGLIPAAR